MKQGVFRQSSLMILVGFLTFAYVRTTDFDDRVEAQSAKQSGQNAANTRAGVGPSFKGPLGLQLYSLRAEFAKDVPGTLARVREMGFREVEMGGTYNLSPQQFRAELDKAGLRAVSLGASFDTLRDNIDAVISNAKTFGVQYVMCAWITHQRPFSEEAARQAIQVFNRAGEKLKAAGITFAYHIHGYEFQPHGDGTLFDLLAAELKPEFVSFELDVFWAFHGGQDPVGLVREKPQRFTLIHPKDMRKSEKGKMTRNPPDDLGGRRGGGPNRVPSSVARGEKDRRQMVFYRRGVARAAGQYSGRAALFGEDTVLIPSTAGGSVHDLRTHSARCRRPEWPTHRLIDLWAASQERLLHLELA